MFAYFAILIIAQFLYGCWVGIQPVQSQTPVITRHNLPQRRLELVYGSQSNGGCTNESQSLNRIPVCANTSVLNDGIIPTLDGISSNETSSWATELFTLSGENGRIILSFEVDSMDHDRMELAVFNCPDMGINSPVVNISFDSSFRPDRNGTGQPVGDLSTESQLNGTSCDHLLVFCVKYDTSVDAPSPTDNINLVFPSTSQTNSMYVFLGEVTFLNGSDKPCDPTPRPGTPTTQGNGGTPTKTPSTNNQRGPPTAIIIATVVVVLVLIMVLAVVTIVLVVVMRLRNYKQKSEVHELQNVVLETKEEEKETESYMDDGYDVVGVKTSANSAAVMDTLYSNPSEAITDETYSHLQDSQKQKVTPQNMATIGCEYSQLNYNQNDSVFQKNGPSTQRQEPTGVGMLYAVPDKKKKVSNSAPGVPEKSSELVEYFDSKEAGIVSSGMDPSECSQTDSVAQRSRPSPAQEKPTDVGMLYAIPDKKKKVSK